MGSSAYVSSVCLVYRLDKVLVLQEIAFCNKTLYWLYIPFYTSRYILQ